MVNKNCEKFKIELVIIKQYSKYVALGNDYLVIDPKRNPRITSYPDPVLAWLVKQICDRHNGVGGDGILLGPLPLIRGNGVISSNETTKKSEMIPLTRLCIFNPDGKEAQKSGNGIRIFLKYMMDHYRVDNNSSKGMVQLNLLPDELVSFEALKHDKLSAILKCDLGRVEHILKLTPKHKYPQNFDLDMTNGHMCDVDIGNPHCVVVLTDKCVQDNIALKKLPADFDIQWSTLIGLASHQHASAITIIDNIVKKYGAMLESHLQLFPQKANVHFMRPNSRNCISILIYERGVGHTLSSGTCSCASAFAAYHLGLVSSTDITVKTQGGELQMEHVGLALLCQLKLPNYNNNNILISHFFRIQFFIKTLRNLSLLVLQNRYISTQIVKQKN
ncbi:diaminopimelate epimerase [Reticulomyxa filosa]|uniref:Diaminopimelate epimerase n=1 Tax=Reticulomyxa filosa TaxID=46433 RepID=X6MAA8_RETFI|nr:diaminopimelate epimerase [Reticulomyxa filosa]|eukprot:ETO09960.1 diaminopimelate epimerase [Reticulomyxa filosa]